MHAEEIVQQSISTNFCARPIRWITQTTNERPSTKAAGTQVSNGSRRHGGGAASMINLNAFDAVNKQRIN